MQVNGSDKRQFRYTPIISNALSALEEKQSDHFYLIGNETLLDPFRTTFNESVLG